MTETGSLNSSSILAWTVHSSSNAVDQCLATACGRDCQQELVCYSSNNRKRHTGLLMSAHFINPEHNSNLTSSTLSGLAIVPED